jgi:LysM repeat protein
MMRRLWLLVFIAGLVGMTLARWPVLACLRDSAGGLVTISTSSFRTVATTVDIDPDTVNPGSQGKFVTAYIELPEGYDVADIDVWTVTLEVVGVDSSVPATPSPTAVGDEDEDGIPDRMVKFSREAVVALLDGLTGDITFRVRGKVLGSTFQGAETIRVLDLHGGAGGTESAAPQGPPPAPCGHPVEYEVQAGDSLIDIAARFGTTAEVLIQLNRLEDPNVILYGSTLNVPCVGEERGDVGNESDPSQEVAVPDTEPSPPAEADSPAGEGAPELGDTPINDSAGGQEPEDAQPVAGEEPTSGPSLPTIEYEVQPGDTLIDIAARFGTTVEVLIQLNGLEDANAILYGSTLSVPLVGGGLGGATAGVSP